MNKLLREKLIRVKKINIYSKVNMICLICNLKESTKLLRKVMRIILTSIIYLKN